MAFTPRTFRRGNRTEVASSYAEETNLLFDGWLPDGTAPPAADPRRHVEVGEIATLPELRAAYVAGRVLNNNGSVNTQKKLTVKLTADGTDIEDLIIESVA